MSGSDIKACGFCLVHHLNLPPLKTAVIVWKHGGDRNIHAAGEVGGSGGGGGLGWGALLSPDWLLKQPRSHFVREESRTCRGCWQSVLRISGPEARQPLILHYILIYLAAVQKGISIANYTHTERRWKGSKITNHRLASSPLSLCACVCVRCLFIFVVFFLLCIEPLMLLSIFYQRAEEKKYPLRNQLDPNRGLKKSFSINYLSDKQQF